MGGEIGNVLDHNGYACMLQTMVESWRAVFSSTPGTTPADAPFGESEMVCEYSQSI
jgi:hypothetical protein